MEINERIKKIIADLGISSGSFAEKIGVQRSSVSHILSGRNKPSADFLEKLLIAYPDIDSSWLLSGIKSRKESNEPVAQQKKESKEIEKIVIFYEDGTFKSFVSN